MVLNISFDWGLLNIHFLLNTGINAFIFVLDRIRITPVFNFNRSFLKTTVFILSDTDRNINFAIGLFV